MLDMYLECCQTAVMECFVKFVNAFYLHLIWVKVFRNGQSKTCGKKRGTACCFIVSLMLLTFPSYYRIMFYYIFIT